ncbi:MAG: hypothetical protein CVT77_01230 [Alphaproteobacteria bacterium HGW-Alphaproteobacteria-16]|nr:MAG: hypothetical protein CVT77_01230 [Alphaproteobacteria bacterium HGW-Alphaproteobacteria-16]
MTWRLVRYELAMIRRNRHAWWTLLTLAALALLSFANLSLEAARANADKREVAAAERERWLGQGEKDPHSAAHYSIFAFKLSPTLATLDSGIEPFVGQSVWLEAHHQNDMLDRPQQKASLLQRAGLASPAGLILTFAPLVAFLLAFVAVAQDRERGTMRLALGASAHPRTIVRAKTLAIWGGMAALLVLPLAALALMVAAIGGRLDTDILLRVMAWTVLMSAYLALLAGIGIVVSLRAPNARIALVLLFALWIAMALVLPRTASSAVDALRPLPSSQAVRQQMLDEAAAYWTAEDTKRHQAQLLARYGVARLEDIPNARMAELDMVERHSHQVFDRVLGALYGRVADQDRLFSGLGFLSPTVAAQSLSASVAGSDFSHHHHFIVSAERYRRDLVNAMNADGMAHRADSNERHINDVRLWSAIPEFTYPEPTLGGTSGTAIPALVALALWLLAVTFLVDRAARRLMP